MVYSTERGPVALPVNFEFTDGDIILSTDLAKAHHLEEQTVVGFEIDRVDEAMSEGWSVLVSGQARRVDDPDEVLRLSSLDLEPWAGGARHALVKITPATVTGRVIVHNAVLDEDWAQRGNAVAHLRERERLASAREYEIRLIAVALGGLFEGRP